MHLPQCLLVVLGLAWLSLASANPQQPVDLEKRTRSLKDADVTYLVNGYVGLLRNWSAAASDTYIATNFTDKSDSINILAGTPLGSVTFGSKAAFDAHEETDPDDLPVIVSSIGPVSGTQIALIWTATFGVAQLSVRGITILGATHAAGKWQISSINVEFNSIAFLEDIGGSISFPSSKLRRRGRRGAGRGKH